MGLLTHCCIFEARVESRPYLAFRLNHRQDLRHHECHHYRDPMGRSKAKHFLVLSYSIDRPCPNQYLSNQEFRRYRDPRGIVLHQ